MPPSPQLHQLGYWGELDWACDARELHSPHPPPFLIGLGKLVARAAPFPISALSGLSGGGGVEQISLTSQAHPDSSHNSCGG